MGKKHIIAGLDLYEDENEMNNERVNSVKEFKERIIQYIFEEHNIYKNKSKVLQINYYRM